MMTATDLTATNDLLSDVFDDAPTTRLDYLNWLYEENPAGPKIQSNCDDEEGRIGHYVVVPQPYTFEDSPCHVALSLNTAVHERGRGQGLFTRLAEDVIGQASGQGLHGIIGVANNNSTPGFIKKLGFELVTPLPVKVGVIIPRLRKSIVSGDATIARILKFEDEAKAVSKRSFDPDFDEAQLQWRLSRPGADYHIYADDHAAIIVTKTKQLGQDFLVVLATFSNRENSSVSQLVSHAAATLGLKFFVYCGWNNHTSLKGLPIPKKYRPSPLNLIWRPLTERVGKLSAEKVRRFEFIDFDAY